MKGGPTMLRCWMLLPLTACSFLFGEDEDPTGSDPDDVPPLAGDLDGDGFTAALGDCDDTNPLVFPGADETCDGVDQDCNGIVDDAPVDGVTYYRDDDQDQFGDDEATLVACARPDGYALVGGDCDDTNDAINPDAEDVPGEDLDCDGVKGSDVASEILSFDASCSAEQTDLIFDVLADGPVSRGVLYLADTPNSPSLGDEHDLFPVVPDSNDQDDDLTQSIIAGGPFPSQRNVYTPLNCEFVREASLTYAVAIYDDADTRIDCVVTGIDPDLFLAGFFTEFGPEPSFDLTTCREL